MAASRAAVRAGYRTLWRTATNTFRGDTRAIVAGRMELRDHVEKERNEKDPAKIGEGVIEGRRLPASVGGTVWRGLGGVLNVRGRRHACCAMISGLLFVHAYCRRPSLCFTPLLSFRVTTSNVPPSLLSITPTLHTNVSFLETTEELIQVRCVPPRSRPSQSQCIALMSCARSSCLSVPQFHL